MRIITALLKTNEQNEYQFEHLGEELSVSVLQRVVPSEKIFGNQSRSVEKDSIYFELTLDKNEHIPPEIGIGLANIDIFIKNERNLSFVGWSDNEVGFHLDNGGFYDSSGYGKPALPQYIGYQGVTVGLCWNIKTGEIFFTKNGEELVDQNNKIVKMNRKKNKDDTLYPTVTSRRLGVVYTMNFGDNVVEKPFKYQHFNLKTIQVNDDQFYSDVTVKCITDFLEQ